MGTEQLFQQNHSSREINESEKGGVGLVITGTYPPEPLDFLKETLN